MPSPTRRRGDRPATAPSLRRLRALALASLASTVAVMAPVAAPAVMAQAAEAETQDWIPEPIALPSDRDVITNREIGASTRMFAFTTSEDGAALMARWREALAGAGYVVAPPSEAIETPEIEFSGPGIGNAKIALVPGGGEGRATIQFDASLTD